ncbi:transcriptional regulator [Nocardia sp. NPDC004604]|uniref:transcriptional regulator n=1 Tax=Nocardia sp. NPDC004604 TaxID=3157013 RepID=UPI0033BBFAB2
MSAPSRRSAHNRPALIVLVIVAALACLALGWWQWQRFESASGTGQNLGYALQWPLFAGFAIFAYFRFVRLETESESEEDAQEPTAEQAPAKAARTSARRSAKADAQREIPAGLLPERPKAIRDEDPELAEYNRYLAELHASDIDQQVRDAGLHARDTQRSAG